MTAWGSAVIGSHNLIETDRALFVDNRTHFGRLCFNNIQLNYNIIKLCKSKSIFLFLYMAAENLPSQATEKPYKKFSLVESFSW
jgi:hypothetical protein